jgi:hypothetical protein
LATKKKRLTYQLLEVELDQDILAENSVMMNLRVFLQDVHPNVPIVEYL